jgi:hypothetical protein
MLKKVNLRDIKFSPPTSVLSDDQVARIATFTETLSEVFPTPLNKALEDFQRDLIPEKEIVVWETLAKKFVEQTEGKNLPLEKKKEIFRDLLNKSSEECPIVLQSKKEPA